MWTARNFEWTYATKCCRSAISQWSWWQSTWYKRGSWEWRKLNRMYSVLCATLPAAPCLISRKYAMTYDKLLSCSLALQHTCTNLWHMFCDRSTTRTYTLMNLLDTYLAIPDIESYWWKNKKKRKCCFSNLPNIHHVLTFFSLDKIISQI